MNRIAASLLICLFSTGCYKFQQDFSICADGSGQVRISLALSQELAEHDGDLDALNGLLRSFEGVRWQPLRWWWGEDGWLHYEQIGHFPDINKVRSADFESLAFKVLADGFLLSVTPRADAAQRWSRQLPLDDGPPDAPAAERAEFLRLVAGYSLGFSFRLPGSLTGALGNSPRVGIRDAQSGGFLLDESNWDFRPTVLDFSAELSGLPCDSQQLADDRALQAEVRQALRTRPLLRVALDGNLSPAFTAEPVSEGCLLLAPYLPGGFPEDAQLQEASQAVHGEAAEVWSALGWDAVGVLAAAMRREGCQRADVQRGLLDREQPWYGATGPLRFDEQGAALRMPRIAQVHRGALKAAQEQLDPAALRDAAPQPAPRAADGQVLKIGLAAPFTGPAATFGQRLARGARLRVDAINAEGGIAGRPIQLVTVDDEADAAVARQLALKLASDPEIVAVIGHFTSVCCLAASEVYADAGLVSLSPGASNPQVSQRSECSFQMLVDDRRQASLAIALAVVVHQRSRLLVVIDAALAGESEPAMREAAARWEVALEVVSLTRARPIDFDAIARQAAEFQPDAVILHTLANEGTAVLEALERLGKED